MRFYRAHDLDLITFIETHEFNIMHAIYCALTALSRGEAFVIRIPPRRTDMPQLSRIYNRTLILDTEKDMGAIEILARIEPGYRNSFLKNLLRQYLCYPMSEEFLLSQKDADYFYELFAPLRAGRREAAAGFEKGTKKKAKTGKKRKAKKTAEAAELAERNKAEEKTSEKEASVSEPASMKEEKKAETELNMQDTAVKEAMPAYRNDTEREESDEENADDIFDSFSDIISSF